MRQALIGVLLLAAAGAQAGKYERDYQEAHCQGETEVVMEDRTRVDCLTDTHAMEYDFGPKWGEAIGQSLYYAFQTNKRAGIVLILKGQGDYRYWLRLNSVIDHYNLPIDTWMIEGWKE